MSYVGLDAPLLISQQLDYLNMSIFFQRLPMMRFGPNNVVKKSVRPLFSPSIA
jgi:hypothetical protein